MVLRSCGRLIHRFFRWAARAEWRVGLADRLRWHRISGEMAFLAMLFGLVGVVLAGGVVTAWNRRPWIKAS